MNELEVQKQKLVDEINDALEQTNGSLVPVLRKSIRLAKVSGDLEHQLLFELHLDGSPVAGFRGQKWPDPNLKPKWNITTAFMDDRRADDEQILGSSVERLEALIADTKQMRDRAMAE